MSRRSKVYYYFVDTKNGSLIFQRDIPEDEFNELMKHISKVSNMKVDNNRVQFVNQEYAKFMKLLKELGRAKTLYDYNQIQSALSNYLFYFKKYLDNWETHLARTYGKKSTEYKCFKEAQANEYDNYMEYRIMYRLRNFDQHCGNIICQISIGLDEDGNEKDQVFTQRDRLLEQFGEWKPEEIDFIKKQEERIDLLPFVIQFQKSITRIHEKIMQIHFNEDFYISCAKIIIAANEFENEEDISIARNEIEMNAEFWNAPNKKQLSLTHLDTSTCKHLLQMHIKSNFNSIKILFHGEHYNKGLNNCAIPIDNDVVQKVSSAESIDLNGQKMLRLSLSLSFDTGEMCAVLADARFNYKQIKQIQTAYSLYIAALCKEPITRR